MSLKKQAGVWKWFSVDVRDIPHRDFTGTCSTASSTPPAPHLSIRESPAFRNVFPNLALGISTCFLQPGCKDRKVPAIFFQNSFSQRGNDRAALFFDDEYVCTFKMHIGVLSVRSSAARLVGKKFILLSLSVLL